MSTKNGYFKELKDIWSAILYQYSYVLKSDKDSQKSNGYSPAKDAFDMFFNISSEICRIARTKKISEEEMALFEIWRQAFNETADLADKENEIPEKTHELLIRMKNFLATYSFENLPEASFNL